MMQQQPVVQQQPVMMQQQPVVQQQPMMMVQQPSTVQGMINQATQSLNQMMQPQMMQPMLLQNGQLVPMQQGYYPQQGQRMMMLQNGQLVPMQQQQPQIQQQAPVVVTKPKTDITSGVKTITGLTIEEKIGQGAFGNVYRGTWEGTEVACKEIKDPEQSQEIKREISTLAALDHPNIVRFYGIYENEQKVPFIVMEYLSKGSLDKFLRGADDNEVSTGDLVSMSLQAAAGMNYLSKNKMVHRDLALRNLLVTYTDGKYTVKVTDFGMSRKLESQQYTTKEAKIPVKWTAPEALKFGTFSAASDVWSFGVLLWEIFTKGQLPYTGWDNVETMQKVLEGYRMPKPKDCPDEIYALMLKCWSEKPEQRPTFSQVQAALVESAKT